MTGPSSQAPHRRAACRQTPSPTSFNADRTEPAVRPRTTFLNLALLALLLGLPVGAGAAQERQASDEVATQEAGEKLFFESLNVTRVNVEVFVTDASGEPVSGLGVDDFELFEDGRRVEITNFYPVVNRRPVGAASPSAAPTASEEPARETVEPAVDQTVDPIPPEDQRLSMVLFFDNLHLRPFNRNRVMRQTQSFLLRHMRSHDRAMLVTFERGLNVRQPFTSDRRQLLNALDELAKLTGLAVQASSERRQAIQAIERSKDQQEARSHADFYAKSVYNDATITVDALKQQVAALAGLPGRKILLYISDGLPMNAGEDLFVLADNRFGGQGLSGQMLATRYKIDRHLRELSAAANSNRVLFYTLEAAGARAHSSLSAEYGGNASSYIEIDTVRNANERQPLLDLARDTGGLATVSTNNFTAAFDRLANDIGTYYSLAFQPARSSDGRYRKIEVKVRGKGLRVRHRRGYRDKTPFTRMRDTTLATLLYGSQDNALNIELELGQPQDRGDGTFLVPLAARIPLANVTLVGYREVHRGEVRVSIAVGDDDGGKSPVSQETVPITIPSAELEAARGKFYAYSVELLMRKGQQDVAVGVRDELAGATSFVRRSIKIGS